MSQYLDNIVSFHIVPDAAVVFEGAGSLLTFQAQLDGSWIVLLLQQRSENHILTGAAYRQ